MELSTDKPTLAIYVGSDNARVGSDASRSVKPIGLGTSLAKPQHSFRLSGGSCWRRPRER